MSIFRGDSFYFDLQVKFTPDTLSLGSKETKYTFICILQLYLPALNMQIGNVSNDLKWFL